jgi:putative FmdB family regulatory protein
MPIYEYKCDKCGGVFDLKQNFSDEPVTRHEGCGGTVERLISAPTFQFKGTGWYVTDYARGGDKKNGQSKDKDATPKKESSGDTKPADSGTAPSKPSAEQK